MEERRSKVHGRICLRSPISHLPSSIPTLAPAGVLVAVRDFGCTGPLYFQRCHRIERLAVGRACYGAGLPQQIYRVAPTALLGRLLCAVASRACATAAPRILLRRIDQLAVVPAGADLEL